MPIATIKQLCTPNAVVTSDTLVDQVAQIEELLERLTDASSFVATILPRASTGW
jgi:hypothetical protein